jgi:hypothetical protein
MKRPILTTSNSCLLLSKLYSPKNLGPQIKLTTGEKNNFNEKYINYIIENENLHIEKKDDDFVVDKNNNIVSTPG